MSDIIRMTPEQARRSRALIKINAVIMTTGIVFYLMTASLASARKVFHIHLIVNGSEQRFCRMIRNCT